MRVLGLAYRRDSAAREHEAHRVVSHRHAQAGRPRYTKLKPHDSPTQFSTEPEHIFGVVETRDTSPNGTYWEFGAAQAGRALPCNLPIVKINAGWKRSKLIQSGARRTRPIMGVPVLADDGLDDAFRAAHQVQPLVEGWGLAGKPHNDRGAPAICERSDAVEPGLGRSSF
jgi:hypothetical protein